MLTEIQRIARVKAFVGHRTEAGHLPYQVEHVRQAVVETTNVDRVALFRVPSGECPIYGKYELSRRETAPYTGMELHADVYFTDQLNYCWRRFVVTKELCQCIFDVEAARVQTTKDVDQLVDMLRSQASSGGTAGWLPTAHSEQFSVWAALEVLCPVEDRLKLQDAYNRQALSTMQLARAFRIPVEYMTFAMENAFIDLGSQLFSNC
ncbi:MAG: hypothetical protein JJ878_11640 [Alphaproteobacteria bacterium]|nr:hypothetical protein [Alphaproteobacteria bacterium]MBO6863282.1 hypothetical protein [Alphaproteobacteria bacterium]